MDLSDFTHNGTERVPFEIAAVLGNAVYRMAKSYWEPTAPTVLPPPLTYAQLRRVAGRVMPRVRFRRHLSVAVLRQSVGAGVVRL